MLSFAFISILVALILLWQASRLRRSIGLPAGRVIYSDTRAWDPVEKPLYDPELGLTGRPDYLVAQSGRVIPIEVKSQHVGLTPHDSHIYQLAAYCLLVHRAYGVRPNHGILHYANRTYAIDYTPQLESELIDLLAEIRRQEKRKELPRSHDLPQRCQACGYRSACDQRII